MKVRYIGAQHVASPNGDYFKVFYGHRPENPVSKFQNDSGENMSLRIVGEKVEYIKATREALEALANVEPGSFIELKLSANPAKPRETICSGLVAAPVQGRASA